ncbi:DeoR/GlpR family DNA-binding transcription regulator [Enterococcus lemanii]|uniref:Lactose phosphotransferase system repressor n=1 Tax=Enterococcus lemanii TaxID=1159752 RepID=A0ABV9MUR5_9ENTE|nr:DeoR/GlpR family DNA-binding transcription regulator [Enterococcus lemanii]MBM7709787.1 DeoR/GlpR family transcriptional regulator of sugar metabolism [Enterococcus lemanii]
MELREKEILTILQKKKHISNKELCEILHCSISSLRRSLIILEEKNIVTRVRGGVMLSQFPNLEYSHSFREETNVIEKKKIISIAKDFVGPGQCIFLDSSSTVQQLIPFITQVPNLVIITNSLKTATLLSESNNESFKIFITGGEINMNSSSVIPSSNDSIYSSFYYDLAFFSCRGLNEDGIYEASFNQATIKKEMMSRAKQKVLLADNTKFDSTHFFKISNFSDYDTIITNKEPNDTYIDLIEKSGSEIIYPA